MTRATDDLAERPRRWGVRVRALACGLAFSLVMSLAFPGIGVWWTAVVAVTPLCVAAGLAGARPRTLGLWAGAGTLPFWAQSHLWILSEDVSAPGFFILIVMLSVYPGVFVWIGARTASLLGRVSWVWACPVVWGGLEATRALLAFDGYPWYLVGHPLIEAPALSWPAAFIGALGVSALAAMVSGLAADLSLRRLGRAQLAGVAIVVAWLGLGPVLAHEAGEDGAVRLALVQTNVPQDNKIGWTNERQVRDFERFAQLTIAAAAREPDLIVWPETMAPGRALDPVSIRTERAEDLVWTLELEGHGEVELGTTALVEQLLALQEAMGVPMLVGAEGFDGLRFVEREDGLFAPEADAHYNAAFILTGGRVQEPWYAKVKLTPFGEVMPYISAWPWLERTVIALGARGMSFEVDTAPSIVRPDTRLRDGRVVSLATPICFEATMSGVCRSLVFEGARRRAGLMINLTNDGWFGAQTRGRRSHLLAARWRCVELGTPMARSANTGVSCVIDARGRVVADRVEAVEGAPPSGGEDRVDGILVADVALATGVTGFARVGDLAGWTLMVGLGIAALLGLRGRGGAGDGAGGGGSQSGRPGTAEG